MTKPANTTDDISISVGKACDACADDLCAEKVAQAVLAERERWTALLPDPVAVHLNMLRGTIAKPRMEHLIHLYGAEALRSAGGF